MGTNEDCIAENEIQSDTDRQRLLPESHSEVNSTMGRKQLLPILNILQQQIVTAVMKLWAFCTTSVLLLVLVYWFYGGYMSILLLIAAFLGKLFLAPTQF